MTANAELTAQVQRLGAVVNSGPLAQAAQGGDQAERPVESNRGANFGVLKTPQFHYGKQYCPEAFSGKSKGGFEDYALRTSNFLATSPYVRTSPKGISCMTR